MFNPEMGPRGPEQESIQEKLNEPRGLKDFDAAANELEREQPGETNEEATARIEKRNDLLTRRQEYFDSLLNSLAGKKLPENAQAPITEKAKIEKSWRKETKEAKDNGHAFPREKVRKYREQVRHAEYDIEKAIMGSKEPEQESEQKNENPESDAKINKRQQSKIIKILETGDADILNQSAVKASEGEKSAVLEKIRTGEIPEDKLRAVVREVTPAYKDKGFSAKLAKIHEEGGHKEGLFKRFISLFGTDTERRSNFNIGFQQVLESCPTVDSLQDKIDDLVAETQNEFNNANLNTTEKEMVKAKLAFRKQLQGRDFDEFTGIVYGKQKEYWDQVKLLKQEAQLFRGSK